MYRKYLSIVVILLFLISSLIPIVSSDTPTLNNIIYVDDDADPGWYDATHVKTIQEGIDNATVGDTVFVYNGKYNGNIIINKTINLIGEEKNSTIIQGSYYKDVVTVNADRVLITGFTIQNSGLSGRDAGIELRTNITYIVNNILKNNTIGIYLFHAHNNKICTNGFISNKDYGMFMHYSNKNTISHNTLAFNRWGIYLIYSTHNNITNNNIYLNSHKGIWISRLSHHNNIKNNIIHSNGDYGLFFYRSEENIISKNTVTNNHIGIYPFYAGNNIITKNNFIKNNIHACFKGFDNSWDENFWGKDRTLPKLILEYPIVGIPETNVDWHPAKTYINTSNPDILSTILNSSICTLDSTTNQNYNLPSYFSWDNINGTDFTTPVKNQAPAPTCEAYALCTSLETLIQYQIGYPFGCDLSETHLFFYSGGTCEEGGVLLGDTAEYLINNGVPDEGCFPDPHRPFDYPFESITGWENRTVKIKEWGWVENNEEAIKYALIEHGPLIIHIIVRKNFVRYNNGIYSPIHTDMIGGHVMTLIGYDDEQRCWIVKNSYGENWGENGFVRISYHAHTRDTPLIWPFYGGTGILYIDEVYGNRIPGVPKIQIIEPKFFHTYIFGFGFPTIFQQNSRIQEAAPRVIGKTNIKINTSDVNKIEVYVDGILEVSELVSPYNISLNLPFGIHTIELIAYDKFINISKEEIDVYVLKIS